jgi:hypothetical protein
MSFSVGAFGSYQLSVISYQLSGVLGKYLGGQDGTSDS